MLSQVLHYGQLSSQFPIYVQLRADSASDAEIQAAEQAARDYFAAEASTRTPTALWYDDGWRQFMRRSYLQNGRGAIHGVSPENVIVLLCDFTFEGENYPSWSLISYGTAKMVHGGWTLKGTEVDENHLFAYNV